MFGLKVGNMINTVASDGSQKTLPITRFHVVNIDGNTKCIMASLGKITEYVSGKFVGEREWFIGVGDKSLWEKSKWKLI